MTSVTLPSTSGPIHRVYSSMSEEITNSESDFESNPIKRCLSTPTPYSCKKRRKQSTPIRISAADWDGESPSEGKQSENSPETEPLQCSVCQQNFDYPDHLQNHILSAHSSAEVKKEPQDEPQHQFFDPYGTMKFPRPELQMMNDLQTKDWMTRSLTTANPMFMHLPQFPQSEGVQRQPIKIFNPDAYCDLCNKEFCNKYFLKTHKANKHGIYTDTTSESLYPNQIPSYLRLPTTVPSDMQLKTEPQTTSNMMNHVSDMFPNPFSNKLSRISQLNKINPDEKESNENLQSSNASSNSGSEKITTDVLPNGESSSPKTIENESTSYKSDQEGLYFVPTSNMSPGQIGFNKETDVSSRLRKIGVMNPKAFCEICCKEYCNKYFLRTHKMKRHGIMMPDERDNKSDMPTSFHWNQSNIQTSPLNLIKTEQTNSERKTTSPTEISCDICEIKFQNASLAQLHNISVHSKLYSKETTDTNEETSKVQDTPNFTSEKTSNSENISEDLKKLQTMILQLNELKVEKMSATCTSCNKEFESRYFLHAHMITEHGILLDEVAELERPEQPDNSSNNNTMCDLCGKDVENVHQLKKHILECHPSLEPSLNNIKEEFNADKTNRMSVSGLQLNERRMSVSLTPTSSYCEICNKELCNKYFMKTHMQRMHGIEIENGAQIGGVVCDICNKELCSKYFLRVHKHNTHGIVEYGTSLLQPKKAEGETTPSLPTESDSALRSNDLADLSHRYFTHFTEVCKICSRRFRSTKWLKAHLLNDHGQAGAEKWADMEQQLSQNLAQHSRAQIKTESPTLKIPNSGNDSAASKLGIHNVLSLFGGDEAGSKIYQCGMCAFTTTLLPLLFVHERSHTPLTETGSRMELKCPVCGQTFYQTELLQHHLFKQHPLFPLQTVLNGSESREASQTPEEETNKGEDLSEAAKNTKPKKKKKWRKLEFTAEVEQSLNDIAKIAQMPVAYALPRGNDEEEDPSSKFVMQAFLMEEEAAERHVIPAVVFLPVLQKQPAPLSVTFNLTPA
ncbi:zinc finger protein 37 [Harmonia axyridis]|uniref:zinc finger protein 37 n=1 Tax=Harmonia axyridis TaxID=115357 RepID=UPI001E2796A4|nr:zinc finger protein 37 [Harmonia axyridis]XP_045481898.1 zinc finger protein 37 [Harmonia axyridis]